MSAPGPRLRSPLGPLSTLDQGVLARRAVSATAVTFLIQMATGWALRIPEASWGIVSLELAGSAERAEEIVTAWAAKGLAGLATANVVLDYSFLVSYATLLVVLCVRGGDRLGSSRWQATGHGFGWGQWLAGALDALEDVGLLLLLAGLYSDPLAGLVRASALGKFGLAFLGIGWVVVTEVTYRVTRR